MFRTKQKFRRFLAWILSVVMILMNLSLESIAEEPVYQNYLDGWKVDVAWNTLSKDYTWNATSDEMRQPKIVVTYRMDHAAKDYPAGSLSFVIPGIGGVKRSGTVKADKLAADQGDSEWNYDWDPMSDTYRFTNKFAVSSGQSVSGGFELLWTLEARDCENGYTMEASPYFSVADAGGIQMEPLSFAFASTPDRYRINMTRQTISGSTYEKENKDYIWYDCFVSFDNDWLARGLYKSTLAMTVSGAGTSGDDVIVKEGNRYKEIPVSVSGDDLTFDLFTERYGNLVELDSSGNRRTYTVSYRIGFKKETLEGNEVTLHAHLDRLYEDDENWTVDAGENECVDADDTFTLHGYSFSHAGYVYNQWSVNYQHEIYEWTNRHDTPVKETDRLNATGLYSGAVIPFVLSGTSDRSYSSGRSARAPRRGRMAVASASEAQIAVASETGEDRLGENDDPDPEDEKESSSTEQDDTFWKPWYRKLMGKKPETDPEELPENWDDLSWYEHDLVSENADFSDAVTFGEKYPEEADVITATDSDAEEEEDYLPDITLSQADTSLWSKVMGLFAIKSFAAETDAAEDVTVSDDSVGKATVSNVPRKAAAQTDEDIKETTVTGSGISESQRYGLALGDDKIAVYLKNGTMRALEDHEYDMAFVRVLPNGGETVYDYEVYGAESQDEAPDQYKLLATGTTDAGTVHQLPDGVKAVYVLVKDIDGSYSFQLQTGVRLHLNWQEEQAKEESERVDHSARLVNFTYMRSLYRDGNGVLKNDCAKTVDDYGGTYGKILADRDLDVFGEGMLRDYSNVWLRDPVTALETRVTADEFAGGGRDGFESVIHASGTLKSDESGTLKKFSLYAVLPEGLTADPDEDEVTVTGSGTAYTGGETNDFASHVSIRQTEWNGKTTIVADFDFLDAPLAAEQLTSVSMAFPVSLTYADFLSLGNSYMPESALIAHDEGLAKISGSSVRTDHYDLDEDGDTEEKHAYYATRVTIKEDATEWREYVSKYVKSGYSTGFVTDTVARLYNDAEDAVKQEKSDYSYRLDFGLGSSNAKNIVFFDRIEQGAKIAQTGENKDSYQTIASGWQGTFRGVDTAQAEKMGLVPTVYYSTDKNQEFDLGASGWSTDAPVDLSTVKSIAVVLDTSNMADGLMKTRQMAYVLINMRAPKDRNLIEKRAVNQYTVQYDAYGLTGQYETTYTLSSAQTQVKLLDNIGKLVLQKVDGDNLTKTDEDGTEHFAALTGAKFQVYGPDGAALFDDGGKDLNSMGRIVMNNVRAGTYAWEEVQAPAGYQKITGKHTFTVTDIPQTIEIKNSRIPGNVTLTKLDADDETRGPIAGAVYQLYQADGTQVFLTGSDGSYAYSTSGQESSCITGTDGTLTVNGLPWGSYYLKETEAPTGYEMDEAPVSFEIGKAQYDAETDTIHAAVTAKDAEKAASIRLTKYDAVSGKTLKNAYYDVAVRKADGSYRKLYEYLKTNAAGELTVENLKFGHYRFTEVVPPAGYTLAAEPVETDLDATTADTVVKISQTDNRKTGSVKLIKLSSDGMPLSNAEFALYQKAEDTGVAGADTLIQEGLVTGADGATAIIDQLTWGDYYFLETKAPQGYQKSDAQLSFTVDASNADAVQTVRVADEKILGSVTLTKMDEATKTKKLKDAQFNLYKNDGSLVKEGLTTDGDGAITVTGLEWGSYYFEETKAPDGYGISRDKVRFSVNEANCTTTQALTCYDPAEQVQITIRKEINEWYEPFGNATFLFEIAGTDVNGTAHTWNKSITLVNGATTGNVILSGIPAGTYTIRERDTERYKLDGITAGANVTVADDTATAVLTSEKEAEVTFANSISQYEKFSHTGNTTNVVNAKTKLTGLQVAYKGPATIESETENSYTFTADDLEAVAFYDDGSSKTISFSDLELDPATVTGNNNSSGAGYTVNVSYTENGMTVSGNFSVEVNLQIPPQPFTVTYDANGGYFDEDASSTLNQVTYVKNNVHVAKVAKTDNVGTDGAQTSGSYGNNVTKNQVVTIPGAKSLKVTITYQTESSNYDWVCLYEGLDITPAQSNYDQSKSGKLGGTTTTTKEFTIQGDTVQIFFRSDSSGCNYYGFYAVVEGEGIGNAIVTGEEKKPSHVTKKFAGWYTDAACSDGQEFVLEDCSEDITVYAKWEALTATLLTSSRNTGLGKKMADIAGNVKEITAFQQSAVMPDADVTSDATHLISTTDSETPIYLWRDGTALLWWSKAEKVQAQELNYLFCQSQTYNSNGKPGAWELRGAFSALSDISGLKNWDVSQTTSMKQLFTGCEQLKDISPIRGWQTGRVTDMTKLFDSCSQLVNLDALEQWDLTKVRQFYYTFRGCESLENLNFMKQWKSVKPTVISGMFSYCSSLNNIDGIAAMDTSQTTDMVHVFNRCENLEIITPLASWNTENVRYVGGMFWYCSSLTDLTPLSGWNTSHVKDMNYMFANCRNLTDLSPLAAWDTSNVTNMSGVFSWCDPSDLTPLSGWNTSNVTNMNSMFEGCRSLIDLTALLNWNTGNVVQMGSMFSGCSQLTDLAPLANWNTNSVTDMSYMFRGCSQLTNLASLANWNTNSVTTMSSMFYGCSQLADLTGLATWNTGNVTNMRYMFHGCSQLADLTGLATWTTGNVTNMSFMFYGCSQLTNLASLANWNTNSVTDMSYMFFKCSKFADLTGLATWNTGNVTNMSAMLSQCSKLADLTGLATWNVENVTNMSGMFENCTSITDLTPIKDWNTSSVTNMRYVFNQCENLVNASAINDWKIANVTDFYHMFDKSPSHPTFTKRAGTWDSYGTFTPTS